MKMSVDIVGEEDIINVLGKVGPRHSRNLMRASVHALAAEVGKDAKKLAPADSGDLKKAIKWKRKKSHPESPVSEVRIEHGDEAKHDAWYWRFVEYGTTSSDKHKGLPARPFIKPAYEKLRANYKQRLTEAFGKKLEQALKREAKRLAKKK